MKIGVRIGAGLGVLLMAVAAAKACPWLGHAPSGSSAAPAVPAPESEGQKPERQPPPPPSLLAAIPAVAQPRTPEAWPSGAATIACSKTARSAAPLGQVLFGGVPSEPPHWHVWLFCELPTLAWRDPGALPSRLLELTDVQRTGPPL